MKLPCLNRSASFFFVSTNLLWFCLVQIDSVKQPIKRNFVGSGHVSHRRTSAFTDRLDHCFVVFKNVKHGFEVRMFCVCDNVTPTLTRIPCFFVLVLVLVYLLWISSRNEFPCRNVVRRMQHFNNQIPKIESGNTIHAKTCIKR